MNLKNVTRLLAACLDNLQDSQVTKDEEDFVRHLQQLLQSGLIMESEDNLEFENRWTLNNDHDLDDDYIIDHFRQEIQEPDTASDSHSSQESRGSSTYNPSPAKVPTTTPETPYETMIQVVEYSRSTDPTKGKWKTSSAQIRFRAIFRDCTSKNAVINKLERFQKYIENQGSRLKKLKKIHQTVSRGEA